MWGLTRELSSVRNDFALLGVVIIQQQERQKLTSAALDSEQAKWLLTTARVQ
jgi:hypothetical protein